MSSIAMQLQEMAARIQSYILEDIGVEQFVVTNIRTILVISIGVSIYYYMKKPSGIPPGPKWTLPIVGDILSFGDRADNLDVRLPFRRLRKQYGDIYSVYFGPQLFIVINGFPLLKEAFVKNGDHFSERPRMYFTEAMSSYKGVVFSSGQLWKKQRKFALETLREFGFGKTIMEDKIHEEIESVVNVLLQQKGKPYDPSRLIQGGVSNVVCNIIFGHRFDILDPRFVDFLAKIEENLFIMGSTGPGVNFWPILRFFPGDPSGIRKAKKNIRIMHETLIRPSIEEHLKNYDEDDTNDYISCYIKEMKKGNNPELDRENLEQTIMDLFVGGTETTSSSILWTIVYWLNHPSVYKKCVDEVQEWIGSGRLPNMKDKPNMPYLGAVIMEVLRIANIANSGIPHGVLEQTTFKGYRIPQEAIVIGNLDSVLSSDEVWGDAERFRPERFLDGDGKLIKREEWVPFSIGRRICLGEALAKMELFLFLTTLLQRFDFQLVDPNNKPCLKGVFGFTHGCSRFEFKAVPR